MKDRLVGKLSLGFILGAVSGNLIVLFINIVAKTGYLFATPTMIDSFGREGAVLLQSLFSGLYGLVCFGGTEFYRIEKWSLLKSTIAHESLMALKGNYYKTYITQYPDEEVN